MKILMIAPTPFFADRGAHTQIYEEIIAIEKLGHTVLLCTYGLGREIAEIRVRRCWVPKSYKKLSAGPSYTKIFLLPILARTVLNAIRGERPDLIHAHLHEGALIAKFCSLFYPKIPIVSDIQGSLVGECVQHGFVKKGSIACKALGKLEKSILSWFPVITQSTTMHDSFSALIGQNRNVHNVLDGVDVDRFKPQVADVQLLYRLNLPPLSPRVLFMGLLEEYQGVDIMMRSFQIIANQNPDVEFIVIGYPNIEKYKQIAFKLGFGPRCHFLGRIDYFEIPKYLSLATVAVAPKISLTEGDGKLYNYMAMAIPTVAFDRPVSREILGDTGIYAELMSVNDLADKIQFALDHQSDVKELGLLARSRVMQNLTWGQVGERIEKVYATIHSNEV